LTIFAYIRIQSNGINPALLALLQDQNKGEIHFQLPLVFKAKHTIIVGNGRIFRAFDL
jgi:hypothetical protein